MHTFNFSGNYSDLEKIQNALACDVGQSSTMIPHEWIWFELGKEWCTSSPKYKTWNLVQANDDSFSIVCLDIPRNFGLYIQ